MRLATVTIAAALVIGFLAFTACGGGGTTSTKPVATTTTAAPPTTTTDGRSDLEQCDANVAAGCVEASGTAFFEKRVAEGLRLATRGCIELRDPSACRAAPGDAGLYLYENHAVAPTDAAELIRAVIDLAMHGCTELQDVESCMNGAMELFAFLDQHQELDWEISSPMYDVMNVFEEHACHLGDAMSCELYGNSLMMEDEDQGRMYVEKSCDMGWGSACMSLATYLHEVYGDSASALPYYRRACELSNFEQAGVACHRVKQLTGQ